ncbi:hypothetical protein B5F53_09980 [Blautia sp. An249]|uniref:hypothetical protein n=1 Tax=Blautia sp. An249 TaxID=1965603 RepID=UPI000B3A262B|nr:hypothetical protein [Blautia sp. An249]OUO78605.1 hypothetical protein B5F53_09980 [Blautia sp. An249]
MNTIWNLTNRIYHGKHLVGAFLAINSICWIAGVFLLEILVSLLTGVALGTVFARIIYSAILAGAVIGVFGGLVHLMRTDL